MGSKKMDIQILHYASGAEKANGLAVIIDVFRAFSLACYLFDRGAIRIIAVRDVDRAFELKRQHPDYVLIGERHARKVPGFDYGNSPTEIRKVDLPGRVVVHTTHAGTQALVAAEIVFYGLHLLGPGYEPERIGHVETRGCLFDFSRTPADIAALLEGGDLCPACRDKLAASQLPQDPLQCAPLYSCQELSGSGGRISIQGHAQGAFRPVGEPAGGIVELHAREPQIEQDPHHRGPAQRPFHIGEIGPDDSNPSTSLVTEKSPQPEHILVSKTTSSMTSSEAHTPPVPTSK